MQIKKIKIQDTLMDAIVGKLFIQEVINRRRTLENAENSFRYHACDWRSHQIPILEVTVNAKLDISEEDLRKYEHEDNKLLPNVNNYNNYPYFSIVSDNAKNDLQVYLVGHPDENGVTCENIRSRSYYYTERNGKYTFFNP